MHDNSNSLLKAPQPKESSTTEWTEETNSNVTARRISSVMMIVALFRRESVCSFDSDRKIVPIQRRSSSMVVKDEIAPQTSSTAHGEFGAQSKTNSSARKHLPEWKSVRWVGQGQCKYGHNYPEEEEDSVENCM